MRSMLDYSASVAARYCNGFVAIGFRENPAEADINRDNYILNSMGDGWFRRVYGIAKGHGLCLNSIKITSRSPKLVGDFYCHKAKINFTYPDGDLGTDFFWLYIHEDYDLEQVLTYIEIHKHEWRP